MVRRIISLALLLCVLCVLAVPAYADPEPASDPEPGPEPVVIRAAAVEVDPGGTVQVPIYVDIPNDRSITGIGIIVSYDGDALTRTGARMDTGKMMAELSDPPDSALFGEGLDISTRQYVILAAGANVIYGEKTLPFVTLTFTVNADAAPGSYPITLSAYGGPDGGTDYGGYIFTMETNAGTPVPYTFQNGTVTVREPLDATRTGSGFNVAMRGAIDTNDKLVAVLYAQSGQMKEFKLLAAAETLNLSFTNTIAANDCVKFLWVTSGFLPRCGEVEPKTSG